MRKLYRGAMVLWTILFVATVQAQDVSEKTVQDLVRTNAVSLHISSTDAGNAALSSYFTDPATGLLYSYIQQTWKGIKVHNTIITAVFRNNKLVYTSGRFVNDIASKAGGFTPAVGAEEAVQKSAEHLQLRTPANLQRVEDKFASDKKIILSPAGIAKQNITAELFWVTDDDLQSVKLAWNINIDVAGSTDWWNVRVDAASGTVIDKDNWTVHENFGGASRSNHTNPAFSPTQPMNNQANPIQGGGQAGWLPPTNVTNAAYNVVRFPGESPVSGTLGVDHEPWLRAGVGNNAITNGWHYDGSNDYTTTRGNNVWAYLDILNNNTVSATNCPDTSSTAIPSLSFTNTPNFSNPPANTINRKFAIDNLFYWNNLMHDVMYQYGFNEASGNFQADNLGRGGAGNDFVRAEAQDASGTNNANFATPSDGNSGRMQMYLFSPVPSLLVNAPAAIAGSYPAVESDFSTANKLATTGPVTANVVYYNDNAAATHDGCVTPSNALTGKIALINRGNCNFTVKVKNAQDAGALAVIMINNVPGDPIVMGGTDNTITIPAIMISQSDGAILVAQAANNINVTISAGVNLDGDLDAGVMCHEYGHGISNRLTGGRLNASCLNNAEQGGEGWSDYVALMMVTNWSTAQLTGGPTPRAVGTYVLGENPATGIGIRTYPYSTNMTVNPHTYADLANVSTEAHYIGEVWTSALWDMTWNIIQQEGSIEPNIYNASSNGGNAISLKLVLEGMRLQSCRPGFLDARNAILAADSILYNYRHKCAIWNAFARRGMGYSAAEGSSNSASDQTAAFDVPNSVSLTKAASPVVIDQGGQVTINLAATCGCQVPLNNITVRDTIPAGFSYLSSTGGSLNGNVVTFAGVNFSTTTETKSFSITIQSTGTGCIVDTAINDNRESNTIGGLTSAELGGSSDWMVSNAHSSSPSNAWYAEDPATVADFTLTSNQFTVGNLSVLSFKHYYITENYIDGGRIEISTDNGVNWIDAGPYIIQNGYNAASNSSSTWGNNVPIFTGVSYGQGSGQFINTIVDLSSFNGQTVRVRWRMKDNSSNAGSSLYEGWFVDDILQMNGCGGIIKAGLYNSSGVGIDNSAFPVFVKPGATPGLTFTSQPHDATVCENNSATFNVSASGTPSPGYQWQLSTDGGANYNDMPGETSTALTVAATAGMNGYKYRAIASNGTASITSSSVTLLVNKLVNITAQPNNTTVCAGSNASFTVGATGSPNPLSYKWQVSTDGGLNYSDISGATASTLTFAANSGMNGTRYRSVVTGACGAVNSASGTLTVNSQTVTILTAFAGRICPSDSAIHLDATPAGGVWSGTGVTGNNFVPSSVMAGSYPLSYTYTGFGGCQSAATTTATVQDCPDRNVPLGSTAIILYPNPNNGQFFIRINSALYNHLGMSVYESNGALVRTEQFTGLTWGQRVPINLSNLASGVYTVKFYYISGGRTEQKSFKIIIASH